MISLATTHGFSYDGVFRHYGVIKGRNTDAAWFSITDEEWKQDPGCKQCDQMAELFFKYLHICNNVSLSKSIKRLKQFVNFCKILNKPY